MALTVKILSQIQRSWGWETALEFWDGKSLVETRIVSGQPDINRLNGLAEKVQYDMEHPVILEKTYTQTEVDKLVSNAVKAVSIVKS